MKFEHETEKLYPTLMNCLLVPFQAIVFAATATEECLEKLSRLLEEFLNVVEYKKTTVVPVVLTRCLNDVRIADSKNCRYSTFP